MSTAANPDVTGAPLSVRLSLAVYASADAVLLALAFFVSAELRFDFALPGYYRDLLPRYLAIVVSLQVAALAASRVYRAVQRYSGVRDLVRILGAIAAGNVACGLLGDWLSPMVLHHRVPYSILAIDFFIATTFVGGGRLLVRLAASSRFRSRSNLRRTLIVGADASGLLVAKHLRGIPHSNHRVVGFVDDAPGMQGRELDGIPILGCVDDIARLAEEHGIAEVVLGSPEAPGLLVRKLLHMSAGRIHVRTVPSLIDLSPGQSVTQVREVKVEDLLRRDPVKLDEETVSRFIDGKTVFVTGGGGSIGSELCRQIARLRPARIVIYEHHENNLYEIHREMRERFPHLELHAIIGSIHDRGLLDRSFERLHADVVFHAAAYKHVPLLEENLVAGVRNNIFGTQAVVEAAERAGVEKFVLISTDKAVRPASILGATKRVAEMITNCRQGDTATRFVTVRFGNVLNSAGSVVPLFLRQIREGGPVTLTHADVCRYFMTIPEASQLVIQAGAQGLGGEIFILDMGEPVRIMELARDLILLLGLRPEIDIPIKVIGLRPGEKLFEDLFQKDECLLPTLHPKIHVARSLPIERKQLEGMLERLDRCADRHDEPAIRALLGELVEDYEAVLPPLLV